MRTTATPDLTPVPLLARSGHQRKRAMGLAIIFLLAMTLFSTWYSVAADYSSKAMAGIYMSRVNGEKLALFLSRNGSFQQQLYHADKVEHAQGTWRRIGEGGVVFSKEFFKMSGQEPNQADEVYGQVQKKFGLFFSITITQGPNSPVFQKQLFY